MIYFAPIQGFTDFIYRNVYAKHFSGVDKYFSPYIQVKNGDILPKYQKEVLLENNENQHLVPQILIANTHEQQIATDFLINNGYTNINLNLGCPYPMVTNRRKGAGLLPYSHKIDELLNFHFSHYSASLSIKLRSGLKNAYEILEIIPILNRYPIEEVIFHPRTAGQLYKGDVDYESFSVVANQLTHPVVYNGDIYTVEDYHSVLQKFRAVTTVMLGRGLLANPFLAEEIHSCPIEKQMERIRNFHDDLLSAYIEKMDNEGNALNKMQQHWSYWASTFSEKKQRLKQIKKCKKIEVYTFVVSQIFNS